MHLEVIGRSRYGKTSLSLAHTNQKFELVIDLKSAKMLGIDLRPTLLATADDVIE